MNKPNSYKWIKNHNNHCLNLNIESDYIERNIYKVEKFFQDMHENQFMKKDMHNFILNSISKKIKTATHNKKNIGLLCSGGEDSIYLLIVLVEYLNINPKLFCYETKNNFTDVERLKLIAQHYKLELNLFDSKSLDRENAYNLFSSHADRPPNDIAQPVHNALYFQAVDNFNCDLVIDGQMCDTVLLSNPQNHFLFWFEKYSFTIKNFIKLLSILPLSKNSKIGYRILLLNELCNKSDDIEIIFSLINVKKPSENLINQTKDFVKKYGIQLVFTIYFYLFLLEIRERDKYLLCPKVFSPFDDIDFIMLTNQNLDQILGPLIRKKPIRRLCKKHFPNLFKFQNTLPFELE